MRKKTKKHFDHNHDKKPKGQSKEEKIEKIDEDKNKKNTDRS